MGLHHKINKLFLNRWELIPDSSSQWMFVSILASGTHFKKKNLRGFFYLFYLGEKDKKAVVYYNECYRQYNWSVKWNTVSGKSLLCILYSLKWALKCHCSRKLFLMTTDHVAKNLLHPLHCGPTQIKHTTILFKQPAVQWLIYIIPLLRDTWQPYIP